jgi:hypothetical protein
LEISGGPGRRKFCCLQSCRSWKLKNHLATDEAAGNFEPLKKKNRWKFAAGQAAGNCAVF